MSRPPGDEGNLAPGENYLLGHRKRINDCLRGLSDFLRCGDRHSEHWRRVKTRLACGCGFNEAAQRVSRRRFARLEHVGWIRERPRKLLFPLTSHLSTLLSLLCRKKGFFFVSGIRSKQKGSQEKGTLWSLCCGKSWKEKKNNLLAEVDTFCSEWFQGRRSHSKEAIWRFDSQGQTAESRGPRTSLDTHRLFWHLRYRFNQKTKLGLVFYIIPSCCLHHGQPDRDLTLCACYWMRLINILGGSVVLGLVLDCSNVAALE